MKNFQKKVIILLTVLLSFTLAATLVFGQVVDNKTVYVCGSINQNPFPLRAYIINGSNLIFAEEFMTPSRDGGPVGLAVDNDNHNLYLAFEFSGIVDVFDARTLQPVDDPGNPGNQLKITLPGATNVAGLVVSTRRQRLYAVDRTQTQLYVYDSNTFARLTAEEDGYPLCDLSLINHPLL